ncbi:MAG: TetR/AcrR family transcriptional regulator [Chromatiaceae bacterium]|nr:TetR/AcrR family transcriptional regulator [Chromatiaceae bacterium]MCP5441856.1 TetR/AcrR family transcriptional regulator [Chromatiaceae bacterium]
MARPIEFERDQVLEKAMLAFWDQGYCATSMTQLVKATKLNPGSIYAAFKSKEELFLATLDHYGEASAEKISLALKASDSPLQGIRNYFRQLATTTTNPKAQQSCLLVNTILELAHRNTKVRQRVNAHFEVIESCFRSALQAAHDSGELSADKDPTEVATFLISSIWGLRVLAGTGPAPARAEAVVSQILKLLD